jgi:hypothetical protein
MAFSSLLQREDEDAFEPFAAQGDAGASTIQNHATPIWPEEQGKRRAGMQAHDLQTLAFFLTRLDAVDTAR